MSNIVPSKNVFMYYFLDRQERDLASTDAKMLSIIKQDTGQEDQLQRPTINIYS